MATSPPLYVHRDGAPNTLPAPLRQRVAVLTALGMGSVSAGTLAAATMLLADDTAARGLALPLFLMSVTLTGSFLAYREASDPARTNRFMDEETR